LLAEEGARAASARADLAILPRWTAAVCAAMTWREHAAAAAQQRLHSRAASARAALVESAARHRHWAAISRGLSRLHRRAAESDLRGDEWHD